MAARVMKIQLRMLFQYLSSASCLLWTSTARCGGVKFDGSFGRSDSLPGPSFLIPSDGGKQVGGNLFHSFSEFGLVKDEVAAFQGPSSVTNIVARVTGGAASSIDGTIKSDIAGANVYFINPAGVMFGPNAKLDISGSFAVTTADYVELADGGRFTARLSAGDVLTSAPVNAFGFSSTAPAPISIQSRFTIPAGKSFSAIGGGITLTDATLASEDLVAREGAHVHLVSVGSAGTVAFSASSPLAPIETTPSFSAMGDVRIVNSQIDTSGSTGGRVVLRGGRLMMEGSTVHSLTADRGMGKSIDLRMSGDVTLTASDILNGTSGPGRGGDVVVSAENLSMTGRSRLATRALETSTSTARAGVLHIDAGGATNLDNSLLSVTTVGGGAGGTMEISTGTLSVAGNDVAENSGLFASATGSGDGGSVKVESRDIALSKAGGIFSFAQGTGRGADLSITATGGLNMTDQARIITRTETGASAGLVSVNAASLNLSSGARLLSEASPTAGRTARGGDLMVNAGAIDVMPGSDIGSNTFGLGAAGNVEIHADTILLSGGSGFTGISSQTVVLAGSATTERGSGGNLQIEARTSLTIEKGARLSTDTLGTGNAGMLTVTGVDVTVRDPNSAISSASNLPTTQAGAGGKVKLDLSGNLEISNAGIVSAETLGGGLGGDVEISAPVIAITQGGRILGDASGNGAAGGITIRSASLSLAGKDSRIAAVTKFTGDGGGHGGSIDLLGGGAVRLTAGARIAADTSGSGTGGNIHLEISGLTIDGKDSKISSESTANGAGGNIRIDGGSGALLRGAAMLTDFGTISTDSSGSARGGNITIALENLTLSGLGAQAGAKARRSAVGGNIEIRSEHLKLLDGGLITVSASDTAVGGDIGINAAEMLIDSGYVNASVFDAAQAGSIAVRGGDLSLLNNASISAAVIGGGVAGRIDIDVGSVTAKDAKITTTNGFSGSSAAGSITVRARGDISFTSGGIDSQTYNSGKAGNIFVSGKNITLAGAGLDSGTFFDTDGVKAGSAGLIQVEARNTLLMTGDARIQARTFGSGEGGAIRIQARSVRLERRGLDDLGFKAEPEIASSTYGPGRSGDVIIRATESFTMLGGTVSAESFEGEDSTEASGASGSIRINSNSVVLQGGTLETSSLSFGTHGTGSGGFISIKGPNGGSAASIRLSGADISASRYNSLDLDPTLAGRAGNVTLEARTIQMMNNASISAESTKALHGGNISLLGDRIFISDQSEVSGRIYSQIGSRGGGVRISGDTLRLANGAEISANTNGAARGGNIRIDLTGKLVLDISSISADSSGTGRGGDVTVRATTVGVKNGGSISADTLGTSRGGDVTVRATTVGLKSGGSISADTYDTGRGGDVHVTATQSLTLTDGADISADSNLKPRQGDGGRGGNVFVISPLIRLESASTISADTDGLGGGGDVSVKADTFIIRGDDSNDATGVLATSNFAGEGGRSGDISVLADRLEIYRSGVISADTYGDGNGGNVSVTADGILIDGIAANDFTGISAEAIDGGNGSGGDVAVTARSLRLLNGGSIATTTSGSGRGGGTTLTVDRLSIESGSSITAASTGTGKAGDVRIAVNGTLSLRDGSIQTTASIGESGLIDIRARDSVRLMDSAITVQALLGDAGAITLHSGGSLVMDTSAITAAAGRNGGNIVIAPSFLDLRNSLLSAHAVSGNGGNISIALPASAVFGDARDFVILSDFVRQDASTRITASSDEGLQGTLSIEAPSLDLSGSLAEVDGEFLVATSLLQDQCANRLGMAFSSLLLLGRGGVSLGPEDAEPSSAVVPFYDTAHSVFNERSGGLIGAHPYQSGKKKAVR